MRCRLPLGRALLLLAAAGALGDRAAARDPWPSFAGVVREATPAVVTILLAGRDEQEGGPTTYQELLRDVTAEGPHGRILGSGFVITADGDVVTNQHVIQGADRLRVRLAPGEEVDARLIGADERTDVALLRVAATHPLPTLELGDSDALAAGDWVVTLGNPTGLLAAAAAGIVSAKGRLLGGGPSDDFLATDALIVPGTSGGPLLDLDGRVVGIATAAAAASAPGASPGFAVPINLAGWVIGQLRDHGRVIRGSIGVSVQPVTPELARSFGLSRAEGALVTDVTDDGPADRAGVQRGDVVVRWDDRPIHRAGELPAAIGATLPGTAVAMTVLRNGQERTVEVTVEESPAEGRREPEEGAGGGPVREWGIQARRLGDAEAKRRGLRPGTGLLVLDVDEQSPADDAGLEPGDVIVQANRQPVHTLAELEHALGARPSHGLLLVRRGTASIYVEMER
ncbi:MAG TPA: trypsin-like peptidase domain-containing protein [Candidatus Binatia bacterium]|nr:trypsin-like peptidase domain-containing protein [Candidatus Binatia bacterium]